MYAMNWSAMPASPFASPGASASLGKKRQYRSSYKCAVSQQKCTAALVWAKCSSHCSVLLCKTGSQQACVTAITPIEICYSDRCAVSQLKCTATLVWAKCSSHCSVLLCKTGSQQACVTATRPMEICCSYKCAVSRLKCTAALVWAKCSSHWTRSVTFPWPTAAAWCPLTKVTAEFGATLL